jgi:hypothetical protein
MKNFDLSGLQEIPVSKEVMLRLFSSLPPDAVLVGGQALVFWVEHFKIDPMAGQDEDVAFVSRDVDFLGRREHVKILADAISGIADYPTNKALTILCGQVFVVKEEDKTFMNIDVIHRIGNMDSAAVRRRAVQAVVQGKSFLVMHPLDVFVSRLENFRGIRNKQDENGLRQVTLAIEVAKRFVTEATGRDETVAIKALEKIAETARGAAGMYARQHGAEVYDAIQPEVLARTIKNRNFLAVRLPRLIEEARQYKTAKP